MGDQNSVRRTAGWSRQQAPEALDSRFTVRLIFCRLEILENGPSCRLSEGQPGCVDCPAERAREHATDRNLESSDRFSDGARLPSTGGGQIALCLAVWQDDWINVVWNGIGHGMPEIDHKAAPAESRYEAFGLKRGAGNG
jgi:hypothetical protein